MCIPLFVHSCFFFVVELPTNQAVQVSTLTVIQVGTNANYANRVRCHLGSGIQEQCLFTSWHCSSIAHVVIAAQHEHDPVFHNEQVRRNGARRNIFSQGNIFPKWFR